MIEILQTAKSKNVDAFVKLELQMCVKRGFPQQESGPPSIVSLNYSGVLNYGNQYQAIPMSDKNTSNN